MNHRINKSSGFTLLEVMVALVIFSVGLLGLAGIQGTALQNNSSAYMRTIAMQQSYNMADLIRANTATDGSINSEFLPISTSIAAEPTDCSVNNNTYVCNSQAMAEFDIHQWQKDLANQLPSGKGSVTRTAGVFEIIIMWDEKRTGATGTDCGSDQDVDLKCYKIHIQV